LDKKLGIKTKIETDRQGRQKLLKAVFDKSLNPKPRRPAPRESFLHLAFRAATAP
jgi:hypothetical protein